MSHLPKTAAAAAACLALSVSALAQNHAPPTAEVKLAMEKLAWIEGTWTGEGWGLNHAGEKEAVHIKEVAEFKLGGVIIAVEGRGWSYDEDGNEVEGHHAFGVMSFDAFAKKYRFNAFTRDGYQTDTTPEVSENIYKWKFSAGPDTEMRYEATYTDDGEWVETGARCVEEKCTQIMEMRLTKQTTE